MDFKRWEQLTKTKAKIIARFPAKTASPADMKEPFDFMALPRELRDMVYDTIAEDDRRSIPVQLLSLSYSRPCIEASADCGLWANYCGVSRTFRKEYIEAMNRRKRAGKVTLLMNMGCILRPSGLRLEFRDSGRLATIGRLEIFMDCFMFCASLGNVQGCVARNCDCGRYLREEIQWIEATIAKMPRSSSADFRCSVALTVRGFGHTEKSLPVATDFWNAANGLTQLGAVDEMRVYGTDQFRQCAHTPAALVVAGTSSAPKLCAQWTRRQGWSPRRKLVRESAWLLWLEMLFMAALLLFPLVAFI